MEIIYSETMIKLKRFIMRKIYFLMVFSLLLYGTNLVAQKAITPKFISPTIKPPQTKVPKTALSGIVRIPIVRVVVEGGGGGGGCTPQNWVLDADNDGHYVSSVTQCASPGAGWVSQTTQQPGDCNDSDPSVWQSANLYIDNDADGYD